MIELNEVVDSYTNCKLRFSIDNISQIDRMLTGEDKKEFQAFPDDLNLERYLENTVEGIRRFMLKESRDDIWKTKIILGLIKIVDVLFKFTIITLPCILLMKILMNLIE